MIDIRRFEARDEAALATVWKEVFPNDPRHNEPSAMIAAKLKVDDLIFVAEGDGKIIGGCIAGYDGHRGWLYAVAVMPGHRGSGAGSRLVEYAVDALRALGCVKVNLQVRSDNAEVVAFYRALGFSVEDRVSLGMLIG